jgi:hypothetical protein
MFKKSKTRRLRNVPSDVLIVMRLSRLLGPELARWGFETVDVRRHLSRRQQRAVELGALAAFGLTTAGLVAKRDRHGSDAAATPAV